MKLKKKELETLSLKKTVKKLWEYLKNFQKRFD